MYRLLFYIKKRTQAKIVLFTGDDNISFPSFTPNIFKFSYRAVLTHMVKKAIKQSSLVICGSGKILGCYQKKVEANYLVLYKSGLLCPLKNLEKTVRKDSSFLFYGNLFPGRWQTLAKFALALDQFNVANGANHSLRIFTRDASNPKINSCFKKYRSVILQEQVDKESLARIQNKSDFLVLAESFLPKDALLTEFSLSTKTADYLGSGIPILALGSIKNGTINYLSTNKAAILFTSEDQILTDLSNVLAENVAYFNAVVSRQRLLFSQHHDPDVVSKKFFSTLEGL